MISISDFSLWEWIKVAGSFVLFFGPGLLLLSFYSSKSKFSPSVHLTFAFGLSLGIWIILLIWLQLFNISLNKYSVRFIFSIFFFLWLIRLTKNKNDILNWFKKKNNYYELTIIIFSILIFIFYAYAYKELVAGMGSDSMHHTLISSLIMKEGQIPKDYGPYAPVVTFSYHFGYHAYIAALSWLSGIPVRLMVVLSGAILMGLASLAGGALAFYLTKQTLLGLLSAAIIGIIYIFPAYSLLWGRFTQLMGTIILIVYIIILDYWENNLNYSRKFLFPIIIIIVSLMFSHYRICIAGIIFTIIWLTFRTRLLKKIKEFYLTWLSLPLGALIFSAPWIIHIIIARQNGYSAIHVQTNDLFYSLDRLGVLFQDETQTRILIGLSVVIIIFGFIYKNKTIILYAAWVFLLAIFSQPLLLGERMDPVTLMVSSYVPIVLLISSGISFINHLLNSRTVIFHLNIFLIFAITIGSIFGIVRWKSINFNKQSIVEEADLIAAEWIKSNIESDAIFMINTYQFHINKYLIIGSDAGYWLPVIAERGTVVSPMVYLIDKMSYYQAEKASIKYHLISESISTSSSAEMLRESGIDYVYIGARGGKINLESVIASDYYEHIFQLNGVNIFRILP